MDWLSDLPAALSFFVGFGGFVVIASAVVAAIVKFVKWVRKPADTTMEKLQQQEEFTAAERASIRESVKVNQQAIERMLQKQERIFEILENDNKKFAAHDELFEEFGEKCNLIFIALMALINEICTKDSSQELRDAKAKLQSNVKF